MAAASDTMNVETAAARLYQGQALAPMVRASTTPLRILALNYDADFVYTEELVDKSLIETKRVENTALGTVDYVKDTSKMSKKVLKRMGGTPPVLLRIDPARESGRLVCQLGSGEPELALKAALHVHKDVSAIDVNMGCPKRFSVSGGMGSALLSDPDRASGIIQTLRTHVPLPISAKIRLLSTVSATLDFITALVNAGALAIAVHGRRVGDESQTPAHWDDLKEVVSLAKAKFPNVNILTNGDFYTRQEWVDFTEETKADGVLLARPALFNTSIFRKPTAEVGPFGYDSPLLLDKTRVVQDYLSKTVRYQTNHKNAKYVVCEMLSNRRAPTPRTPYLQQTCQQTIQAVCDCHSLSELCRLWKVDYQQAPVLCPEAPVGEHKYQDSYFLGANQAPSKPEEPPLVSSSASEDAPPAKRVRVEG